MERMFWFIHGLSLLSLGFGSWNCIHFVGKQCEFSVGRLARVVQEKCVKEREVEEVL